MKQPNLFAMQVVDIFSKFFFPMSDRKLHPRRQPDILHWQLRARPEQPARPAVRALRQEAPHQRHLPGLRQQVAAVEHLSISTYNIYTNTYMYQWTSLVLTSVNKCVFPEPSLRPASKWS